MFLKKFTFLLLNIFSFFILSSWNGPLPVSRQFIPYLSQETDDAYRTSKPHKVKQEKKKIFKAYAVISQKNKLSKFAERDGFIWFNDKSNKHTYFLSNSYPFAFQAWNMQFRCAEAAFHAAKFLETPKIAARFTQLDGEAAWKLAKQLSYQQRPDWYQIRESVMLAVLRAKFQQSAELADLLLITGDAYLVEHSDRDSSWADNGDGTGKNRLGHLLMQIRGEMGGIGQVAKPKTYRKFVH